MKFKLMRWLAPALLLAFVSTAHARWAVENGQWERQNNAVGYNGGTFGIPPNNTGVLDTTFMTAAASRVDTTAAWNMLDCDNMTQFSGGVVAADDSLASAFFIIVADSSVASTVNFTSTTIQFQVNYGTSNASWVSVNGTAYPHNFTTGAKVIHQPIWSHLSGLIDKDATAECGGVTTGGTGAIFAPRMRAIVTWGAAAAAPMCRIVIKKWITQTEVVRQGKSAD